MIVAIVVLVVVMVAIAISCRRVIANAGGVGRAELR